MVPRRLSNNLRTWIEIDASAIRHNVRVFRSLLSRRTKLWSVVKSNAYGHGIGVFARIAERAGVDGFCVDSAVEGVRLRELGITKPILVMGLTMPSRFEEAAANDLTITVSTREALRELRKLSSPPKFHIKIDTGMHRHGFQKDDLPRVIKLLKSYKSRRRVGTPTEASGLKASLTGIFTHFASAKDTTYTAYTEAQFKAFEAAVRLFERSGFTNLTKHCAATGGTLVGTKYHLDAVRVGIGLYGLYPSKELEIQLPHIRPKPVLSWRTIVGEVKRLEKGDYVGYDLTERIQKATRAAILPIGYWHGIPRSLSSIGSMLIRGRRVRIIGRVSMDIVVIGVPDSSVKIGDVVTLIGEDGREEIRAGDIAAAAGTTHYEFITRLNPLIERIVV